MALRSQRNTGHRRRRGRELRRTERDRKIFSFLRLLVSKAEHLHRSYDIPVEPLSVFYGKPDLPGHYEDVTPFPMGTQENGLPMPQWDDLSQWMKVMMAIMLGHEWDLLTFNIHLHAELEIELAATGRLREKLAERVRKHLKRALGTNRELFFVIESVSKHTGQPTFVHIHGAIAAYRRDEEQIIKDALAHATGHDVGGRGRKPRAVHGAWFHTIAAGYGNYLFKFAKKFDPRLDERRLVMSQPMTAAARDLWTDITRPLSRAGP